jgi:hypothetical protein
MIEGANSTSRSPREEPSYPGSAIHEPDYVPVILVLPRTKTLFHFSCDDNNSTVVPILLRIADASTVVQRILT